MKKLQVPFVERVSVHSSKHELLTVTTALMVHELTETPWKDYPYRPNVSFKLAYLIDGLLLHFSVRERDARAVYRQINDPVYKDSCVEFFLSFDRETYYNLEFNRLGVGLAGFGNADKDRRRLLSPTAVNRIRTYTLSASTEDSSKSMEAWELLLSIPFTVFEFHKITSLTGWRCRGNFFKCGDDTVEPHFVAWSPIDHPIPNFHLPQFFGELQFGN